jgi:uncharacterized protein
MAGEEFAAYTQHSGMHKQPAPALPPRETRVKLCNPVRAASSRWSLSSTPVPNAPVSDRTSAWMASSAAVQELEHAIVHAAHLLPAQGPLSVFVHHNTLHAFEHLPFAAALSAAAATYGCETYLSEQRYRQDLARGRIRIEDLATMLQDDLGEDADVLIGMLGARYNLRLGILQAPLYSAPPAELRWVIAETDALRKFRSDASAEACRRTIENTRRWVMRDFPRGGAATAPERSPVHLAEIMASLWENFGAAQVEDWTSETWEAFSLQLLWELCMHGAALSDEKPAAPSARRRHRDMLLDAAGLDSDELVHEVLIRFCAVFLDQGMGHWELPGRDAGLFRSFLNVYGGSGGVLPAWLREARPELERLLAENVSPLESIQKALDLLGVDAQERDEFIAKSLLALSGWAGMMWQMETNAEWTVHPAPAGSLVEFLAVRLLLDRFAVAFVAKEGLRFRGPLQQVRSAASRPAVESRSDILVRRAFQIFQLAQARGWKPEDLYALTPGTWRRLVAEIEALDDVERRRIFFLAYERRYRMQTLDAIETFNARREFGNDATEADKSPLFQLITCLDEREESFRRHLEEVEPRCETLGAVGFFGVAMYYRGVAEANSRPLCPVVIKPQHYVQELPARTFTEAHQRRAQARRWLGAASHQVHRGSRSLLGGAVTAVFGSLASIPLVARILFPRTAAQMRQLFGRVVAAPTMTQLLLERSEPTPGPEDGHIGYTVDEMTNIVERTLRDTGLTRGLSRLVIVCGHGSSSVNNPHGSAYDCGACGGGRGGPNARAFARMANDPRVRVHLAQRGLALPAGTHFVGAFHNTCNDGVTYLDLDRLPVSHIKLFDQARRAIDEARQRNAHERCRRFESAPLSLTPEAALRHVEGRSEDLAQVRPECGHATNAVCFVGRRDRTRGLYMDRRTFLTSYDPAQDDEDCPILTRILGAVIPVCSGISLEYYFSFTDPARLGCSTKLPHNITSLLGVMDGAASDLRPGLPWQMVEIHEPMRLIFVIETTPEKMLGILDRNPPLAMLCRNEWVQLTTLDPDSPAVHVFHCGKFELHQSESHELPEVTNSADWYRGWRDHLGYALVAAQRPRNEGSN